MKTDHHSDNTYTILQQLISQALFGTTSETCRGRTNKIGQDLSRHIEHVLDETENQKTLWRDVFKETHYQQVVSLTFPALVDYPVPDTVIKEWSRMRDQHLIQSARNRQCHFALHDLLTQAGIPYVILKGVASGAYYPDPVTRSYGDVDFLVRDEDMARTSKLLESNGFIFEDEQEKHISYRRDGITYELHREVCGMPHEATRDVIQGFLEDILENAHTYRCDDRICFVPSPAHHAIILLLHKIEHLRYDGIGFRHICDWAAFVDSMPDSFFTEEIGPHLKDMGIWHFAVIITDFCIRYLGLGSRSWAKDTDPAYLEMLHEDIISSGNFGIKSSQRERTARRHAAHRISRGERGFARVFVNMMGDSARAAFPITRRKPLLLPAACAYVGIRHIGRILKGNRSVSGTSELISEAQSSRAIFEEWHLFDPEA